MKECKRVECMGSNGCIDKCWKPQRTWFGLTDEEQQAAYDAWQQKDDGWGSFYYLIEAKLKEKNT